MLVLANDWVVDISVDRARYHALRRHIGNDATHRQLYDVVDVVLRKRDKDGVIKRGWTEYDYDYSGYTAADIAKVTTWPDQIKTQFYEWLRQGQQVRKIDSVKRRLEGCHQGLTIKLNSSPQHLFSSLRRRLAALPLKRATVSQWRATIKNLENNGLKHDELQWSGVLEFLNQHDAVDRLHKQEVLAAVDFSSIRVELATERVCSSDGELCFKEVAYKLPHQAVYRAALKLDSSCHCILRYVDEVYNYRVGVIKTLTYGHFMALNKYWFALDSYGRAIANPETPGGHFFSNSESAMQAASAHASQHLGFSGGVKFKTRYDHLTLYGGSDYREWLVTLPDHQRSFFGAHFYDHNVLAHVRTTTRTDCAGRKLLFVEEMQSDWHQTGSKFGYDNSPWGRVANAPFKKSWVGLVCKLILIRASQNGYDGIAWPHGEIQELRYAKDLTAIKRRYDVELPKTLNRLGKSSADSVTTTWIETRNPWLNIVQAKNKWQVADCQGKFCTKPKYSRDQAMEIMVRHSKVMDLQVPVFFISDAMRWRIAEHGLPMFGESFMN